MKIRTVSAGFLIYRFSEDGKPEVLLAHPGGPFNANKDDGFWTIPKGKPDEGESLYETAIRETHEEIGTKITVVEKYELQPIIQSNAKQVFAWAVTIQENIKDGDPGSNLCKIEYPYKSGKFIDIPEIDKIEWFSIKKAIKKILKTQIPFLYELENLIKNTKITKQ